MLGSMVNMVVLYARLGMEFLAAVPKTVIGLSAAAGLVLVAQPANAATQVAAVPAAVDPSDLWGCPTIEWLGPITGASQDITGMVSGFVIIAILAIMLIAGITMIFANKRVDRAEGAVRSLKGAASGGALVLIGIPIVLAVLWAIATGFNPACR